MLLDPFEEQLDLPPAFVQFADGHWWRARQVGQEDQSLVRLGIFEANSPQVMRKVFVTVEIRQRYHVQIDTTIFWQKMESIHGVT